MNFDIELRDDHLFIRALRESLGSEELMALKNILEEYPKENVILHFAKVRSIRQAHSLEKLHTQRRKQDLSFIVIISNSLEDEMDITSTFSESEAYDILELEILER